MSIILLFLIQIPSLVPEMWFQRSALLARICPPQFHLISPMVAKTGFSYHAEKKIQNAYPIRNFILNNFGHPHISQTIRNIKSIRERTIIQSEISYINSVLKFISAWFENSYFSTMRVIHWNGGWADLCREHRPEESYFLASGMVSEWKNPPIFLDKRCSWKVSRLPDL